MARIALVGATGGIGRHVLREALHAGHDVVALARRPDRVEATSPRLRTVAGDVRDPAAVRALVDGADLVISALGTRRTERPVVAEGTAHLLAAMEAAGVRRLAWISSVGVGDSVDQAAAVSRVFRYVIMPTVLRGAFRDLGAAERAVAASPVSAVTVRPTGLTNGPGTGRWCATTADDRTHTPLRIARADVAAFLVSLVDDTQHDGRAVSLFSA